MPQPKRQPQRKQEPKPTKRPDTARVHKPGNVKSSTKPTSEAREPNDKQQDAELTLESTDPFLLFLDVNLGSQPLVTNFGVLEPIIIPLALDAVKAGGIIAYKHVRDAVSSGGGPPDESWAIYNAKQYICRKYDVLPNDLTHTGIRYLGATVTVWLDDLKASRRYHVSVIKLDSVASFPEYGWQQI